MDIKKNIQKYRQILQDDRTLVAVSKTQSIETILQAYDSGHRVFGENKVQELVKKFEALPMDIEWHMIGHMQTNKVKYITPFVHLIHSVDSHKLLVEINKQGQKCDRVINCLLQIHIATEETKFGFSEEEVVKLIKEVSPSMFPFIKILGLMGMASFTKNKDQVRNEFRRLKTFFETLKVTSLPDNIVMKELSMGMSSDYTIALEEGSTMIRIGSDIFGERIK